MDVEFLCPRPSNKLIQSLRGGGPLNHTLSNTKRSTRAERQKAQEPQTFTFPKTRTLLFPPDKKKKKKKKESMFPRWSCWGTGLSDQADWGKTTRIQYWQPTRTNEWMITGTLPPVPRTPLVPPSIHVFIHPRNPCKAWSRSVFRRIAGLGRLHKPLHPFLLRWRRV